MPNEFGYDVAGRVLARLSPGELDTLPDVWEIYWENPTPPTELAGRDRLLGGGTGELLLNWAPLVVAFVSEVLRGAAVDSFKDGLRAGGRRVIGRLRPAAADPSHPPGFDQDELGRIRQQAFDTALQVGHPPEQAGLFADAVVGGLTAGGQPSTDDPDA